MTPSRAAQEKPTSPRTMRDVPILVRTMLSGDELLDAVNEHPQLLFLREAAAATPSLAPSIVARIFEGPVGDRLYFVGAGYGTGPDETVDKVAADFAAEYTRLARLDEGSATPDQPGDR